MGHGPRRLSGQPASAIWLPDGTPRLLALTPGPGAIAADRPVLFAGPVTVRLPEQHAGPGTHYSFGGISRDGRVITGSVGWSDRRTGSTDEPLHWTCH